MESVRWLGFVNSGAVTKTLIHFYPSNGTVSAPYAATCKISLFGSGIAAGGESVMLDGLRLSQPDGLRVDEAFPKLRDSAGGSYGVEIEIATNQPRTDLSSSVCVIELRSGGFAAKFFPYRAALPAIADKQAAPTEEIPRLTGFPALKDAYSSCSIVVVNTGSAPITPKLCSIDPEGFAAEAQREPRQVIMSPAVEAHSVKEIEIPESFWERVPSREQSWGLVRSRAIYIEHDRQDYVGYFSMTRDAKTQAPLSVSAL